MKTGTTAILLLSHGSRDPRTACVINELVSAVAAATGMTVRAAYLDFSAPTATTALARLAAEGFAAVRVVPLLFTPGYHLTQDVPQAVAASGVERRLSISVAPSLLSGGRRQRELLLKALSERLIQSGSAGSDEHDSSFDGLVLASAGSGLPKAREAVEDLAGDLARSSGLPVEPAFASAGIRTPTQALEALAIKGVQSPAVSSLFVAPGRLTDSVFAACPDLPVADPLGVSPAFVELLVARARN